MKNWYKLVPIGNQPLVLIGTNWYQGYNLRYITVYTCILSLVSYTAGTGSGVMVKFGKFTIFS